MSTQSPEAYFESAPRDYCDDLVKEVLNIAESFVKSKKQEGWTKDDFANAMLNFLDDPSYESPAPQADESLDFDCYLKSLVSSAHASVNARADQILHELNTILTKGTHLS